MHTRDTTSNIDNFAVTCDIGDANLKGLWVLCAHAKCDAPTLTHRWSLSYPFYHRYEVANCHCVKGGNTTDGKGRSVVPGPNYGALAVNGGMYGGGQPMCDLMKSGVPISTWGRGTSAYKASQRFVDCPKNTPFAFCWGAPCKAVEGSDAKYDCACPMYTPQEWLDNTQVISVPAEDCRKGVDRLCDSKSTPYNSMYSVFFEIFGIDRYVSHHQCPATHSTAGLFRKAAAGFSRRM